MIALQVLQSLGTLACVVLASGFFAAIGPARHHDAHMMHRPGACPEGVCDQP